MLKEIRQLGFPVVELGHAIRFSLWPGIVKAWEEDLIRIQTLHNFCPVPTSVFRPDPNCYEFSDSRPAMRAAAIKATEETIRHAARFGSLAVICHLGSVGPWGVTRKLEKIYDRGGFLNRTYTNLKVQAVKKRQESFKVIWPRVKACLEPVVALAGELNVRLGFEIRQDFEEFPDEEEFPEVLAAFPPRSGRVLARFRSLPIEGIPRLARPRRDAEAPLAAHVWRSYSRLPPSPGRPPAAGAWRNCIYLALAPDAGKRYRCT